MKIVGERLQLLRESIGFSQMKIARLFGVGQSSIYRYESAKMSTPLGILVEYADFFEVCLNYIFGRTENPHGMIYKAQPKIEMSHPEIEKFIEMCFEPKSMVNKRLRETLRQMLREQHDE